MMRTEKINEFEKRFYQDAYQRRRPVRAIVELTYRCNFECVHCYVKGSCGSRGARDELRRPAVFSLLKKLKEAGVFYLGFTGGEVFMRKDAFDIFWYAKKLGFQIIIMTNGALIDACAADEIARLSPNKVDITVHAMARRVFDRITGVAGSAGDVFKAIELLRRRNVFLGIKSCGMVENKDEVSKISAFARKIKVFYRLDNEITPRLNRSKEPLAHLLSPEAGYALRKVCYPAMFRRGPDDPESQKDIRSRLRNAGSVFSCGCGYTHLAVNPRGELKMCIQIDYPRYNLLRGPFEKGWNKIKKFVDGLTPPRDWACLRCQVKRYCSWCPARPYLEDGTFFNCDAYSRSQAEFLKTIYEKKQGRDPERRI